MIKLKFSKQTQWLTIIFVIEEGYAMLKRI